MSSLEWESSSLFIAAVFGSFNSFVLCSILRPTTDAMAAMIQRFRTKTPPRIKRSRKKSINSNLDATQIFFSPLKPFSMTWMLLTHSFSLSHTHTFSLTHSLSHTHTHSLSLTHTYTHSLFHPPTVSLLCSYTEEAVKSVFEAFKKSRQNIFDWFDEKL